MRRNIEAGELYYELCNLIAYRKLRTILFGQVRCYFLAEVFIQTVDSQEASLELSLTEKRPSFRIETISYLPQKSMEDPSNVLTLELNLHSGKT